MGQELDPISQLSRVFDVDPVRRARRARRAGRAAGHRGAPRRPGARRRARAAGASRAEEQRSVGVSLRRRRGQAARAGAADDAGRRRRGDGPRRLESRGGVGRPRLPPRATARRARHDHVGRVPRRRRDPRDRLSRVVGRDVPAAQPQRVHVRRASTSRSPSRASPSRRATSSSPTTAVSCACRRRDSPGCWRSRSASPSRSARSKRRCSTARRVVGRGLGLLIRTAREALMSFAPAATRRIGRRDVAVSQLGVGTAPFGSPAPADTDDAIHGAFAALYGAGLRYYDTAPFYGTGLAEHRLGACLRRVDRRSVVVSSKVGRLLRPAGGGVAAGASSGKYPFEVAYDYSYDGTMRSIEHSLQRLGTNALDIVLIHDVNRRWQGDLLEQRYAEAMTGALQGAVRAARRRRDQGVRRRRQRLEHPARFAARRRLRLLHAGRPLHAARPHRARDVHARLRAPRHIGADGRTLQLGHPGHRCEGRRDVLLRRGRARDQGAHATDRSRLRAPRRRTGGRCDPVSVASSRGRQRSDGHAQRSRGHARISPTAARRFRRTSGTSSSPRD